MQHCIGSKLVVIIPERVSQNIDLYIQIQVPSLHVKAFVRKSIKKVSSLLLKKNAFMIIFNN